MVVTWIIWKERNLLCSEGNCSNVEAFKDSEILYCFLDFSPSSISWIHQKHHHSQMEGGGWAEYGRLRSCLSKMFQDLSSPVACLFPAILVVLFLTVVGSFCEDCQHITLVMVKLV
eukprot:TRINITY_DN37028_c0_g1_i1.p1 TRINITY_DN37028_c0_g1~~TRINITY_DN37028_c0_g1_i1.p1  ORF type:complete len:116 (-),score=17.51 TRINITY_DN37028_c0_g1_i1:216-563(-)